MVDRDDWKRVMAGQPDRTSLQRAGQGRGMEQAAVDAEHLVGDPAWDRYIRTRQAMIESGEQGL